MPHPNRLSSVLVRAGICSSISAAKRLIKQGGVKMMPDRYDPGPDAIIVYLVPDDEDEKAASTTGPHAVNPS